MFYIHDVDIILMDLDAPWNWQVWLFEVVDIVSCLGEYMDWILHDICHINIFYFRFDGDTSYTMETRNAA